MCRACEAPRAVKVVGKPRKNIGQRSASRDTRRVAVAIRQRERPVLSVVIPLYNEEETLPLLYERVTLALQEIASYEIVLVNDGSRDGTLEQLRHLVAHDEHVAVLSLSRNFGHQAAITAGLEAARGEAIVLMDGDLQDPPEVIPELLREWRRGFQVVEARRRSRQDPGLRGLMFLLFHRWFGMLSDFPLQPDTGIFGLLDRTAADGLIELQERNRFLPGLRSWIGFRRTEVYYDRAARAAGQPNQSFSRLLRYGFDAVFSFSYKPLRLSWILGMVVSTTAFTYAGVLALLRLLEINVVSGFTTPTVAILFLGGVQLVMVGILGEYLGRIYDEVKKRPHYLVNERLGLLAHPAPQDAEE
jgi:polyisoprenyl-phosphate glycosyltransferase